VLWPMAMRRPKTVVGNAAQWSFLKPKDKRLRQPIASYPLLIAKHSTNCYRMQSTGEDWVKLKMPYKHYIATAHTVPLRFVRSLSRPRIRMADVSYA